MTPTKPFEQGNGASASKTVADTVATAVRDLQHDAVPVLERATARAGDMAQRGIETVRDGSRQLRDRAMDASDKTVAYIKDEPVKSMLIAAATGAALMALITLASRSRHSG